MTVAFIGHRKIDKTDALIERVRATVEVLIEKEGADTFLFGSRSEFNDLCYEIVSELKNKYKDIRRVYVRAEYEYINDEYSNYLLESYEQTLFPETVHNAGVASYIKRNEYMIETCDVLILYYIADGATDGNARGRKSGTSRAARYAAAKKVWTLNVCE